ncbi:hypothetical protein [Streptomyces atratus]|uniref:hypothetical protein n=1 Tax=Streptomyces atratus TaxID=1893 RepID=UPI0013008D87|nr:hypothetical protein [Streptomyces atratus]
MPVALLGTERARCGIPSESRRRTAAAGVPEPRWEAAATTEEERDAELEEALSELRKAVDSAVRGFTDGSRP